MNWHADAELTEKQVAELHGRLLEEHARLTEGLRRHIGDATAGESRFADEADLAARSSEQAFLLRVADKEHKLLKHVVAALAKMRSGDYGICEATGEPIGYKRLRARPWTRYSIEYKVVLERARAGRPK